MSFGWGILIACAVMGLVVLFAIMVVGKRADESADRIFHNMLKKEEDEVKKGNG